MNDGNLQKGIPYRFSSDGTASAAGKKSAEARRNKRALRTIVREMLDLSVTDPENLEEMAKIGIDSNDQTYQTAFLVSMLNKAIGGDVAAAEFIRDTAGESPNAYFKQEELTLKRHRLKLLEQIAENGLTIVHNEYPYPEEGE